MQKCFEYASKQTAEENYDYATELLAQCVLGDPGNIVYVQNFISNLQKKYRHNKKGSRLAQFRERGARTALKKASSTGDWDEAIKNGIAVLKVNPWDVPTLTAMASASAASGFDECKLYYLRCAIEINPKDPDVNRLYAIALEKRGQVDQAIARWHREEQDRPGDE